LTCGFVANRDYVAAAYMIYICWHEIMFGYNPFRPSAMEE
jgi:hypothetical protein